MLKIRVFWRNFFDVRPGEYARTFFMGLYLLCVLFAYYILKPVSQSLFLAEFKFDDLPYLYILIAFGGGLLAYSYSRFAARFTLRRAVFWSMTISILCLLAMWRLIALQDTDGTPRLPWMMYVLNVWVSLFSIVLVSQGWLVAANVFTAREAKRVYGLLGLGAVLGAALGAEFTRMAVAHLGSINLMPTSAVMVALAYGAFRMAAAQEGVALGGAHKAIEEEAADFSFPDVVRAIATTRHLKVIISIILMTYMVDVLIGYQFQASAAQRYSGDDLTAFLASFYGLYLNLTNFALQFLLTSLVVARWGVGGTLQILPASVTIASLASFVFPGVTSAAVAKLAEATNRHTLNRTGMELLYLPLPLELKNRTKAFVDIFVDRFGRGIGGILLLVVTRWLEFDVRQVALLVMALGVAWMVLASRASREYIATVRKRFEQRRLDLESSRLVLGDPSILALLEQTALTGNARQAAYALSRLSEIPRYSLAPLLKKVVVSESAELRAAVYELARSSASTDLLEPALKAIYAEPPGEDVKQAVAYVLKASPERDTLARKLLDGDNCVVAEGVLAALETEPELAAALLTRDWITSATADPDPRRRYLAALAVEIRGDQGTEALYTLLEDSDHRVASAALKAAGATGNIAYVPHLIGRLAHPRSRGAAAEALAKYGPAITGRLGELLCGRSTALQIRRQLPRVLKRIPGQGSVDALLRAIAQPDLSIREATLKALNRLREQDASLNFDDRFVTAQVMEEARYYFELRAALAPVVQIQDGHPAANLLSRSIEERLDKTLDRLFRLLGLRYPPMEIHSAYLALKRRDSEKAAAALEFLESVLDRELKRVLLPLLDAPETALERGRELFGLEIKDVESALRELLGTGDPWLMACAMAAAGELKLRDLARDIEAARQSADPEVAEVALAAQKALAA
jgi:ATP:ADP antiporter, AAA family